MPAILSPLTMLVVLFVVYRATVYALPLSCGVVVGRLAYESGAGWLGACVVFAVSAAVVLALVRWLFAALRDPAVRILLVVVFVSPAVLVSYFFFEGLSVGHISSEGWRQSLCALGAGFVGGLALGQLVAGDVGYK